MLVGIAQSSRCRVGYIRGSINNMCQLRFLHILGHISSKNIYVVYHNTKLVIFLHLLRMFQFLEHIADTSKMVIYGNGGEPKPL
jgi:hypothetical protein